MTDIDLDGMDAPTASAVAENPDARDDNPAAHPTTPGPATLGDGYSPAEHRAAGLAADAEAGSAASTRSAMPGNDAPTMAGPAARARGANPAPAHVDAASDTAGTASGTAPKDTRGRAADELFPGDAGTLPQEVRETLVQVLTSRFIDGVRYPKAWLRVQRHEEILRSRLHDMYLDLVLDRRRQVAFTRQIEAREDIPVLLRKEKPLTVPAAILLLHLRQEYDNGAVEGREVVVEHEELLEHLEAWRDADDQNPASFRKRCEKAIETIREKGILVPVSAGRYRISGIVHSLLTAEKIEVIREAFEDIARGGTGLGAGQPDEPDEMDLDEDTQ